MPTTGSLAEEIVQNAISAAVEDPRFMPMDMEELRECDISVDVLGSPQRCSREDLDPKRYGVIVSRGIKKGLLLPELEGVDTSDVTHQRSARRSYPKMQTMRSSALR